MAEQDDLNRLLVEGQNYLGSDVRVPFQGQGDLAGSAGGGLPAAAGGSPGSGSAPAQSPSTGLGGQDALALALQSLGVAGKTGKGLIDLLGSSNNRGGTGGVSLADQLRGLLGSAGGAAGGISGGELEALRGLFGGVGTGASGASLPGFGQSLGQFDLGGTLSDILRSPGLADQPFGAAGALSGAGAGGGIPGTAEAIGGAGAGASGALGGVASGAGILSAILSLIASQTGNQDLATAASGVGAAGTAASTAGALAGASAGGGIAGTGATTALGAVSAPAAVLAAPIVGTLLADSFFSKKGEDIVSDTIRAYQGAYPTFPQELLRNEGLQNTAFDTFQQALPYVQSKEELGQLINSMKNYESTTTGIGLDASDPYTLQAIPGSGPVTHGQQTPSIDWGPETQQLQGIVNQLLPLLPGQQISAQYGQPGGGLEGEAAMRLWSQFMDRGLNAPQQENMAEAAALPQQVGEGYIAPGRSMLSYGMPGYDYASSGFPAPGQYFGNVSPTWQQFIAQQGGGGAAPAAGAGGSGLDSIAAAALATPPGDFAGGMLPEDERKKLLA